ncbi:TAT-variant-translocated molybdopterin oxidoreductase [Persicobacter sp. CCB-QB2]|uniref:TAT-variant-translocated molybdopterin oxidoreductase n=1 Tax=Persicobacter sp. CCB-QB2 TaxID=1561025 RepID=UPI0006A9ECBC|nr:TAT-variant-translocated molybdopterin oxidoreductase [Persicobacter sp. CCB-QB2]
MEKTNKRYWKGIEELKNDPEFVKHADKEFAEYLPINESKRAGDNEGPSRRDFLKMMGFSVTAAALAACEAPVRKAIPYLNKPVDVDPGKANYYASSFLLGGDYASVVVKTREGRPIKLEGNKLSSFSQGGVSAQVESSVLSLYDKQRFTAPQKGGQNTDWATLDKEVMSKLKEISAQGGKIALVSHSLISPSTNKALAAFAEKYGNVETFVYDPVSVSAIAQANEWAFGTKVVPTYDFSKADVIVSFDADFLNNWVNPIANAAQYAETRKVTKENPTMSRHYQVEANLSMTGANADYRAALKPSQIPAAIANLYNAIAKQAGRPTVNAPAVKVSYFDSMAKDLWNAKGKSLVVAGVNDPYVQVMVNAINDMLGNYTTTINLNQPVLTRQGDEKAFNGFVKGLNSGAYAGVFFLNCNPVYDNPHGTAIKAGLKKAKLTVATSDRKDETTDAVTYVAPDHHFLEQWNDAEPTTGHFALAQPTISPLFATRQMPESFLAWTENKTDYYTFLQNSWKADQFEQQSKFIDFGMFWDQCLHDGVFEPAKGKNAATAVEFVGKPDVCAARIAKNYKSADVELSLYTKFGIGTGVQANNPWLQELPDAVTKATWDNYLTVSQSMAKELGIEMFEGDSQMVELTIGNQTMEVPVMVQPGQAKGSVGLALGYGRTAAGRVADGVGVDANPLVAMVGDYSNFYAGGVSIKAGRGKYRIAQTQTHQTYMGRHNVIQETTLGEYQKNPSAGRVQPEIVTAEGKVKPKAVTLWNGHQYENHHWMMAIDMNACNGCGTCVVSCNVENNVPVVGKEEVLMRREMHWLRIDRYYSSDADAGDLSGLEEASDNPEVTFQPMMCQHCNNAPCETVCPVAATTHSSEGLNQMTYNRCIGTRYCANNCPYKVRRFNWFKYHDNTQFDMNLSMSNDLGKMVLNPDVTVRSRGVMEKCSFCVQRIQGSKLEAKREGRPLEDGEVTTACAASCSTGAIVFGDINDPKSQISQMLKLKKDRTDKVETVEVGEERAYAVLEEINVLPNVYYMTKIRNKNSKEVKA